MSSDSSEDEDLSKLREAADSQFISDAMYKETAKRVETPQKLPSLRRCKEDDDEQFNFFRVTPEFRNYVAKHLTSLLDKTVVTVNCKKNEIPCPRKKQKRGIKLLRSSSKYIKLPRETEESKSEKTVSRFRRDEEIISEEDLKAVAVDADFVKNETLHWSKRSKAPIYRYKSNTSSGKLEEI